MPNVYDPGNAFGDNPNNLPGLPAATGGQTTSPPSRVYDPGGAFGDNPNALFGLPAAGTGSTGTGSGSGLPSRSYDPGGAFGDNPMALPSVAIIPTVPNVKAAFTLAVDVSYQPVPATAAITITEGTTDVGPYLCSVTGPNTDGSYTLTASFISVPAGLGPGAALIQPGDWPLPQINPNTFVADGPVITGNFESTGAANTINTPGAIAPLTARLDRQFAALLGDRVNTAFQDGKVYSASARAAALTAAILTYSDYRPCLRRFGDANLLNAATGGDTAFLAVGGVFNAGDTLIFDASGRSPEQVVIFSVEDNAVELPALPDAVISAPALVTLTAPLAYNHAAGSQVTNALPGLSLVAGQNTYTMPADWIQADHESFDLAVGAKLSYSKHLGYYDATIGDVNALSGQGVSDYGNYAGGFGAVYGLLPIAATDPQGRLVPGGSCQGGQTFRFYQSQPARLRLIPAPAATFTLDFDYLGCHTGESVPMRDHTSLLEYALYAAKLTRSAAINEKQDTRIGDNIDNVSRNAKVLQTAAETHLKEFEKRIINTPFCISG